MNKNLDDESTMPQINDFRYERLQEQNKLCFLEDVKYVIPKWPNHRIRQFRVYKISQAMD